MLLQYTIYVDKNVLMTCCVKMALSFILNKGLTSYCQIEAEELANFK